MLPSRAPSGLLDGGRDPHGGPHSRYRLLVLALACTVLFGNYFAYDQPAALNVPLRKYLETDKFDHFMAAVYVTYSLPNIFLPLLAGLLVDIVGPRRLALLFSSLVVLGQLVFSVSVTNKALGWAIFGRLIFGLGGETLSVVQQCLTTRWFVGKELAFAMGINLAVARLGSVLNDIVSPMLAFRYSVPGALYCGVATCVFSLLCTLALLALDRKFDKGQSNRRNSELGITRLKNTQSIPQRLAGEVADVIADMRAFPAIFHWMQLAMVLLYGISVPFNAIHAAFLAQKWYTADPEFAAQIMGVPDTVSAILVPFTGAFFDRLGYRAHALVLCGAITAFAHFALGSVALSTPVGMLLILGCSYALLLTFIPCTPLVVSSNRLGTAYGISTSLANLSWTVFSPVVSALCIWDPTYFTAELFFSSCGFLAMLIGVHVVYLDRTRHKSVLRLPSVESSPAQAHQQLRRLSRASSQAELGVATFMTRVDGKISPPPLDDDEEPPNQSNARRRDINETSLFL